jgi:hypothetical protein
MRIPLDRLEDIYSNPDAFIAEEEEEEEEKHIRPGRHSFMQNALLKWHKGGISADEARQEMIGKCEKFKNQGELKRTIRKFDRYVQDYEALDTNTRFTRLAVKVPLPKDVDRRFEIESQVRRLDKNSDGTYTAWLFYKERTNQHKNIHLPLLQSAVASRLNLDLNEIKIGIYCFADGSESILQFSQTEVDAARVELQLLLTKLAPLAEREPMPPQMVIDFDK